MTARRLSDPRVFFPWEKRRGLFGALGRARARLVLLGLIGVAFLYLLHRREEHAAAVRATRATITTAGRAISAYRADHGGACPRALRDLVSGGYARDEPADAWGRPLRLVCPGRADSADFDLSSDGPDGLPDGLDRVE
jgi:general secretion pathway protein G